MKTLTPKQTSEWLTTHSITEAPYSNPDSSPTHYLQFRTPHPFLTIEAFFTNLLFTLEPKTEALVQIQDWALYTPSQMLAIQSIRKSFGEHQDLIESPEHLISMSNPEQIIALMSLTTSFDWNTYLYIPEHQTTIYN